MVKSQKRSTADEGFHAELTSALFDFMHEPAVSVTIHDGVFWFNDISRSESICLVECNPEIGLPAKLETLKQVRRMFRRATTADHIDVDINIEE